jgi:hypothetical protein
MAGIIIIVGAMGSGKTTLMKEKFIKGCKMNAEAFAPKPKDFAECKNVKVYPDFTFMLKNSKNKVDTLYVVDEAFTVIPKKEPDVTKQYEKDLAEWLVNSRKCNNLIFMVFHSLKQVPTWLLAYSEVFIRFGTMDQLQFQKNRFDSFPPVVESLEKYPRIKKYEYDEIILA